MSSRAVCRFCGLAFDSKYAMGVARRGGRLYCDEACHMADDTALAKKVANAALMFVGRLPNP